MSPPLRLAFVLLAALLLPTAPPAAAQPAPGPLRVGVFVDPPFVMPDGDDYTGMAVELWEEVATKLGHEYSYVESETVRDLIDLTESGEIDVAVTNLSITPARAERVDFTQPWFDGGMRIMVAAQGSSFRHLIDGLGSAGFLRAYAWIAAVVVGATVVLTVFDRRFDQAFPARWRDGIAESFYTVMSVVTSGRPPARKNLFGWAGRMWQGVWLLCGIAVLAFVTSSVTSVMTTLSLTHQIQSVADLAGKPVGVLAGTVEEDFAEGQGFQTLSYPHLERAVEALLAGDVTAIIADAPVLEYHAHTHPERPVKVVGRPFQPDKYGFAVPRQSELRRPITVQLLGALESGRVEDVRLRYFGGP